MFGDAGQHHQFAGVVGDAIDAVVVFQQAVRAGTVGTGPVADEHRFVDAAAAATSKKARCRAGGCDHCTMVRSGLVRGGAFVGSPTGAGAGTAGFTAAAALSAIIQLVDAAPSTAASHRSLLSDHVHRTRSWILQHSVGMRTTERKFNLCESIRRDPKNGIDQTFRCFRP